MIHPQKFSAVPNFLYGEDIMITKLNPDHFDQVFKMMEESFPIDEYRPYEEQKKILNNPLYCMYTLQEAEQIQAFIALWVFEDFAYIEHFAVDAQFRGGGTGSRFLQDVVKLAGKPVYLEVEPPETDMAKRRITFYQRNGFCLNLYPYMMPSYGKGRKAVPLLIMSSGGPISQETFEHLKETLYTLVYKA